MSPKELTGLLVGLDVAAEVVEAIDDPVLQRRRGWDLSRWRYDMVPWGVRFTYHDPAESRRAEVLALVTLNGRVPGEPVRRSPSSTVLVFG